MRAIHSHRAHSATSQGVYLSGRRTPGGTSRARRLLATNTALLTSAHRMISPPSHKRKPCTLPTHPPLHNPTKPKTAASKQKGTHTTRSLALSPNTPNTKPSLALLSSSPALGRFSLSPCARRHPERRAEAISPSSRLPRRRQPLDDDGNGRRSDKPRTAHHPAAASHPLHNDTSQRRRRSRHQHATRSPARTHTRTRKQPLSDRKKEAESERKKKKAQRPPTSTHAKHTRPSPLTRTPCAGDTGRAAAATDDDARGPPHKRARGTSHEPSSRAKTQPRAEQPSLDARATCSSSQCRGARTRHASTPTRARPLPLWPRTRAHADKHADAQGGKARAKHAHTPHAPTPAPRASQTCTHNRPCPFGPHAHRAHAHAHTRTALTHTHEGAGRCLAGEGGA
jgi:hypothetical protein